MLYYRYHKEATMHNSNLLIPPRFGLETRLKHVILSCQPLPGPGQSNATDMRIGKALLAAIICTVSFDAICSTVKPDVLGPDGQLTGILYPNFQKLE